MKITIFSKEKCKLINMVLISIAVNVASLGYFVEVGKFVLWLLFFLIFNAIYCSVFFQLFLKLYYYRKGVIVIDESENTIFLSNWIEKRRDVTHIFNACIVEHEECCLFDNTNESYEMSEFDIFNDIEDNKTNTCVEHKSLTINNINVMIDDISGTDYNKIINFFRDNREKYSIEIICDKIFKDYRNDLY